jgi:hypothetical protein
VLTRLPPSAWLQEDGTGSWLRGFLSPGSSLEERDNGVLVFLLGQSLCRLLVVPPGALRRRGGPWKALVLLTDI